MHVTSPSPLWGPMVPWVRLCSMRAFVCVGGGGVVYTVGGGGGGLPASPAVPHVHCSAGRFFRGRNCVSVSPEFAAFGAVHRSRRRKWRAGGGAGASEARPLRSPQVGLTGGGKT